MHRDALQASCSYHSLLPQPDLHCECLRANYTNAPTPHLCTLLLPMLHSLSGAADSRGLGSFVRLCVCRLALDTVTRENYVHVPREGERVKWYQNPTHPFCILANVLWWVEPLVQEVITRTCTRVWFWSHE